jgi:hypothetical protein
MCAERVIAWSTVGRLAILIVVCSTRFAHADCKPAAIPDGDPDLVKNLSVRLAAHGIATTSTLGCPAVTVRVEQRGQQVHVRLADAFQRQGERDVRDVATAAAIVESWTLQVIDEGSMPPLAAPPLALVEPPHAAHSGIAASIAPLLGTNGSTWIGGGLGACARLGPTCAGAELLAAVDTRATGDTATVAQDGYAVSALATIDLPLRAGGFTLSPGIGLGYTYTHIVTHHMDAMHNPLDVPQADHALRSMIHVSLARSLSARIALFGDLAAAGSLVRSDSTSGPTGALWLSFGLRLEAP